MFKLIDNLTVQSDKGFIVKSAGRFNMEYIDGGKKVTMITEPGHLNGRNCIIIHTNAFEKWDDGTLIAKEKQAEIIKNYTEAMEFQDMGVIVDDQINETNPNSLYAELQRELARNPNVTGFEEIVLKNKDKS